MRGRAILSEGISEVTLGRVPVGGKSKDGVNRTVAIIVRSDVLGRHIGVDI
jgi:hypothetical protein